VRPRVFGAPNGFIGAPTGARERPAAPATQPGTVMSEGQGDITKAGQYTDPQGLLGGARS